MKYSLCYITLCCFYISVYAQYPKIGNLITNSDGSKGVVFWVSPDGSGGWMVALRDLPSAFWGNMHVDIPGLTNIPQDATRDFIPALYDTSGYNNTAIIRQFQGAGNEYAAQKVDFENGWYLPAIGQVQKLKLVWAQIKPIILDNEGEDLVEDVYWTSSELNQRAAWTVPGGDEILFGNGHKELEQFRLGIRPIRSFTNTNLTYRWSTGDTTPSVTVRPDTTTDYQVTMTSAEGWSTTATQRITVNPSYTIPLHKTISKGESYDFRGRVLTEPGVYDDSLKTTLGCDSIYRLTLTLGLPSYLSEDSAQICDKESFLFRGEVLTETGVYDDTLRTAAGTDSIFRLHLTVNPTHLLESRIAICENETHDFRGKTYNTTGIYDDSLKTMVTGCDSIYRLHLTVNPIYNFEESATICQGEIYDFHGQKLTTSGVYRDSLKTTAGCDSVYRLTLKVNPTYLFPENGIVCQGEEYSFRGRKYNSTGVYDDTLNTVAGCDSIFRLHLTVNPTHLLESHVAICKGETHHFRGETYNMTGVYDDSLKTTVTGCDSIYRLYLTVNPIYNLEESATICQGEIYDFHGQKLTTSGVYRDSLKTAAGCDSVYRLTLTVNPTYLFPENGVICQGEEYNFRGRKFNSTGVYDDTLKTVAGCDSIFRLHLTVNPTHLLESHVAICKGETHHFRGETYNETGVYDDSLKTTATGCDSIYRLYLTVNPTYNFEESATICQGEMYDFHGQKLTTSGVYRDSLKTAAGCDSVYRLTLTVDPIYLFPENGVICQGEEYNFRGRKYNSAGVYDDALKTVSGCDSIFRLHLTVNPTYHPVIDTLICRGERYLANGFDETESGEYTQSLTTAHGCDSIVTLKLRVADYFDGDIDVALEDCRTHEYRFTAMNRGTADDYSYLWNLGDGTTSTETETLHHYADSGTYPVTLTVTTAHRCAKEMSVPVQVPYFSEDFEITAEPAEIDDAHPEISFSTACVPGLAYLWDFGDGAIGTGCKTAHQYALREKSWYQVRLTVSNREDCSTEEEMQIMSWSKVKGINTFSPNGDGINDIFRPGFHVKVFNRNGLLIFEGDDGWDGTYKGKQVPADVYFYEAEHLSTQGTRKDNGYITVIR